MPIPLTTLHDDECDAIDAYHLDREIEYAHKGEYLGAEEHKLRRAKLREFRAAPDVIRPALLAAYTLLDSVAFVSQEGDTDEPLRLLRQALGK